ncbi:hypothetical protein BDFG_01461 [Blastomyces dermatitidis ATCC 26199]|nr:hypothetical protein BDFG_01461 [Blastomyces dermatitidis ATCC 26199]
MSKENWVERKHCEEQTGTYQITEEMPDQLNSTPAILEAANWLGFKIQEMRRQVHVMYHVPSTSKKLLGHIFLLVARNNNNLRIRS